MKFLQQPWPWYLSGPAITGIMAVLLFSGKSFGFSSNLSNICSMFGLGKRISLFDFDWKKQQWNLWFLAGSVIGGWIAAHFLQSPDPMHLSEATISSLGKLHIVFDGRMEPASIFNWHYLLSVRGMILFFGGGY